MHHFACIPDCPLEIWADWLEDHNIDPGEVRLLAAGWIFPGCFFEYNLLPEELNGYPTFGIGNGHEVGQGCGFHCQVVSGHGDEYVYEWFCEWSAGAGDGSFGDGADHGYHTIGV